MTSYQELDGSQTRENCRQTLTLPISIMLTLMGVCLIIGVSQSRASFVIEVDQEDLIGYVESFEETNRLELNDRPIIGVLSQEIDLTLREKLPSNNQNYTSYIVASYVQWIEAGGARAVPVIIGKEREHYVELFSHLNGLLIPGGDAPLTGPGGYAEVGQIFFELAIQSSEEGDPFPIWGTCNGFELLTVLSSKDQSRLTPCNSEDQASPLHLLPGWRESHVLGQAPPDVLREVTEEKVTINFHHFCLTPRNFTRFGLDKFWNPLSYNFDTYNLEYLSTLEAKNYPFLATQFHPEKNIFEWSLKEPKIPHSSAAIHVSLYFASYFVNMSRKSQHRFPDRKTEESFLIYNYSPHYVGKEGVDWTFQETYLF